MACINDVNARRHKQLSVCRECEVRGDISLIAKLVGEVDPECRSLCFSVTFDNPVDETIVDKRKVSCDDKNGP
jgi:hypothetical protein